jgi:hypothetical protein
VKLLPLLAISHFTQFNMLTIIFGFSLIFLTIYHWRRRRLYELASKIPGPKGNLPLFGASHKFIGVEPKDCLKVITDTLSSTASIEKIWFGTKLLVVVNTPETFKTIFNSALCLNKPGLLYDGFFSKNGLLSNNGIMQEKHRKILNNSMTPFMLNQLNPIFNEKIKACMSKMRVKVGANQFNIGSLVAACTLETFLKGNYHFEHDCYGSVLLKTCERWEN